AGDGMDAIGAANRVDAGLQVARQLVGDEGPPVEIVREGENRRGTGRLHLVPSLETAVPGFVQRAECSVLRFQPGPEALLARPAEAELRVGEIRKLRP